MTPEERANRTRYIKTFHDDFGISIDDLAKHYGMNRQAVADLVKDAPQSNFKSRLEPVLPDLFFRWLSGESVLSLARAYGCHRGTICVALRHYGPKMEPEAYERECRARQARGLKRRKTY